MKQNLEYKHQTCMILLAKDTIYLRNMQATIYATMNVCWNFVSHGISINHNSLVKSYVKTI